MKRDTRNAVRTILFLFVTAAVLIFALSVAFSAVAAPSMQEVPLMGGLDTDQCDPDNDGWHFIATRADSSQVQGSFVWIVHESGAQHDIALDKLTGQAAHYLGTEHGSDAGIVGATLHIAQGWDGRFVLSHPPCDGYVQPTPTPTETVPPGECPSTHHGCTPPPPLPTRTETPSPTPTPTPTDPPPPTSPSPSSTPSPTPTNTPSTTPTPSSTPSTPGSPTPSPSEPTPTVSPSDAPPSTPSETQSTRPTTAPTPTESFAPPADSSTPRSELPRTGVNTWLLGAGAIVLSVLGAAFATYGGRMEGRR